MFFPPFSSRTFLIATTSAAFLTNEAAIIVTPISQPNIKSDLSLSVRAGNWIETPGTLTPL
ncbi:Uncharacterised protein [Clostridioides difficile]|nr:Uncharacterised protein [Clostridioides difficile]